MHMFVFCKLASFQLIVKSLLYAQTLVFPLFRNSCCYKPLIPWCYSTLTALAAALKIRQLLERRCSSSKLSLKFLPFILHWDPFVAPTVRLPLLANLFVWSKWFVCDGYLRPVIVTTLDVFPHYRKLLEANCHCCSLVLNPSSACSCASRTICVFP